MSRRSYVTVELYNKAEPTTPPARREDSRLRVLHERSHELLDTLRESDLPAQFDRSYFGAASSGLIAQTRGTLRFLDLIDDDYRPTPQLAELLAAAAGG